MTWDGCLQVSLYQRSVISKGMLLSAANFYPGLNPAFRQGSFKTTYPFVQKVSYFTVPEDSTMPVRMKAFLLLFFCCCIFCSSGFTQRPAMALYAEFGGAGLASIDFDSRFYSSQKGFGGRIGLGGFSVKGKPAAFFPIELNYITGKQGPNYFETGAGITFVSLSDKITPEQGATSSTRFSHTFAHVTVGYRFQPLQSGFLFRVALTPLFNRTFFIPYYMGLGVGYKF